MLSIIRTLHPGLSPRNLRRPHARNPHGNHPGPKGPGRRGGGGHGGNMGQNSGGHHNKPRISQDARKVVVLREGVTCSRTCWERVPTDTRNNEEAIWEESRGTRRVCSRSWRRRIGLICLTSNECERVFVGNRSTYEIKCRMPGLLSLRSRRRHRG